MQVLFDIYRKLIGDTYINNHLDEPLSKALLAQLKAERPDLEVKQFLQYVAYGKQDEAEALLKQDPQLAQKLLQANSIPFTDYSGRTFNCTAYEYAYWAKDTHMQRMLEKYIRIDEETRLLIFHRVQEIEKPVPLDGPVGICERFFGKVTRPQGLHYITRNKQDIVIEHQDAGFDLTPLIKVLEHYTAEYRKKLNKTREDWEALQKIWIKEVGRAQREIPAHVAQEYCHPERAFDYVRKNKDVLNASNPSNLKRQLKFQTTHKKNNTWFSPKSYLRDIGLGFSFGISCGNGHHVWQGGAFGDSWTTEEMARDDLAALKIISEVRTKDREQSLRNLSQPLNPQASQSHGL